VEEKCPYKDTILDQISSIFVKKIFIFLVPIFPPEKEMKISQKIQKSPKILLDPKTKSIPNYIRSGSGFIITLLVGSGSELQVSDPQHGRKTKSI